MLAAMVERQDVESLDLNNQISIEITTASFRTNRGRTVVCFIGEETPYWRSEESANPDQEILASVRPAMATIPNALLFCIGSPYRRAGAMYETYKRHYGHDSPILVVQATSQQMNPCIPDSVITRAMEVDPVAAQSEFFAQFRNDIGSFLDSDSIDRSIECGRQERSPQPDIQYVAFCDPSGGAHDSMTLAIAHRTTYRTPRSAQEERDQRERPPRVVLDVCRAVVPPFSPDAVVKEFCQVLRTYHCSTVVGDRYSMEWVRESFARQGILYKHSELTASECYLEALPLFMTGCVELLDIRKLTMELQQLERRTGRSGKDSVSHPPSGHDDLANSCCGALSLCTQHRSEIHAVKFTGF
jgi:hypothetical protein